MEDGIIDPEELVVRMIYAIILASNCAIATSVPFVRASSMSCVASTLLDLMTLHARSALWRHPVKRKEGDLSALQ